MSPDNSARTLAGRNDDMRRTLRQHLLSALFIFTCGFFCAPLNAQTPFHRGVNLTGWFQANGSRQIQFTRFIRDDFQHIKDLGCDVIRLPINLHAMTSGEPDYTLDTLFLSFLDSVVNWCNDLDLHLILDNHTFDVNANTDPAIEAVLVKVWGQMAAHYKDQPLKIYYEILNEPHGISDALWGPIQQSAIDAIRISDTVHTIVVGPANWNSYNNLANLPLYADDNLIYTFHFYDPFVFTHQGASWTNPSMEPLAGVPFPYDAAKMPSTPPSLAGTWIGAALNNYSTEGNIAHVHQLIDVAANFKATRDVPIFCGEFGVYIPNSDPDDRVTWYQEVRDYLEVKNIAWTIWDYTGGFGLFEKNSNELFESDLNTPLLSALGLNVPAQTVYVRQALTEGFTCYDDYIGHRFVATGGTSVGTIDYYQSTEPYAGNYCIHWSDCNQYETIGFDFRTDVDLALLPVNNYVLGFWIRGNTPGASFDVRFIDSDTDDPQDHPWRMGITIDDTYGPWDGQWHHVQIPLSQLQEKGAWEGQWYPPDGKFDWHDIDRLEIVAEQHALAGMDFWFDDMAVTGPEIVTGLETHFEQPAFSIAPNPASHTTVIRFKVDRPGPIDLSIYSLSGARLRTIDTGWYTPGDYRRSWNIEDDYGNNVAPGMYLCVLRKTGGESITRRIVLLNK